MSDCSIWLLPTFAKEVENYLTWTCSLRQSSGVYRKDLLLPSGGILFPFTPSKQFNWLSGCDSGMQGVFPRRGTHFKGTVHNPSHYSWIPSSFSMTDSHEQPQWLPLLSTRGICSIFSLMRNSDSGGSGNSGVGAISHFQVSKGWKSWFCAPKTCLQQQCSSEGCGSSWLAQQELCEALGSVPQKMTGCRVEMICSSFHWAFLKVMHWIKATQNNLKGCKRS